MSAPIQDQRDLIRAREREEALIQKIRDLFVQQSHEIERIDARANDLHAQLDDIPEACEHHRDALGLLVKGQELLNRAAQKWRIDTHPSACRSVEELLMDSGTQIRLADEALERAAIFGAGRDAGPGW